MSVVKLLCEAYILQATTTFIQQCCFQGNTSCNIPQNVSALLNNVHLKTNFNEQDLMTIHVQEQYSSCIQICQLNSK